MTPAELEQIAARAEGATEGEWTTHPHDAHMVHGTRGVVLYAYGAFDGDKKGHANAAFVAHARADVPALVAYVRRLREVAEKCEWVVNHNDAQVMGEWCPCCRGDKPRNGGKTDWTRGQTWGHSPDCELAAALGVGR